MIDGRGTLADRTAAAGQWRLAGSAVTTLLQLVVGAILARLLTPADFGVMALATVVLGFAQRVGDLGVGGAIVQRAVLTDRHVRTAFTASVLLGLALAIALAGAAPISAVLTREPSLTPVLRVLAFGFAFGGPAVAARGLLRRQLDFRRQFFIDVGSHLLGYGVVSVTLALLHQGVWSLVWGGLTQGVVAAAAQLAAVRHPVRPLIARRELGDLLRFGVGATASGAVNYIALNGDNVVVGRLLGAASLGLYSRAYTLMSLPFTYAASVMSSVLLPAFARAQGEPARLRRAYLLMTQLTAMTAAPAMVTMAVGAPYFVRALYGSQWTGAIVPLQILCVAGYFRALYHVGGVVAQSVGRVYGELWNQLGYATLVIAGVLIGSRFDLAGVSVGICAAILYMFVASGQLALRITGATWRTYFGVQRSALLTAAVTGAVAASIRLALESLEAPSTLIALAVLAGAAVPSTIGVLWSLGEPGLEAVRARLPRRTQQIMESLRGWC